MSPAGSSDCSSDCIVASSAWLFGSPLPLSEMSCTLPLSVPGRASRYPQLGQASGKTANFARSTLQTGHFNMVSLSRKTLHSTLLHSTLLHSTLLNEFRTCASHDASHFRQAASIFAPIVPTLIK